MSSLPAGKLTVDDILLLPEDGMQHELLDGEHVVNAVPSLRHQQLVGRLFRQLSACVDDAGLGEAFLAPVDVVLSRHDLLQPDLLVVLAHRTHVLTPARVHGAPDLVVEVLSPSTASRDRDRKLPIYAASGVPELWLVDGGPRIVEQHVLEQGAYRLEGRHANRIDAATIAGVSVDLSRVW